MVKTVKFSLVFSFMMGLFFLPAQAQLTIDDNGGCIDKKQKCPTCACLDVWRPVCGCDGNTYSNSCYAYNNGVTSWTEGTCSGVGGNTSLENEGQRLMFQSDEAREIEMNIFDTQGRRVTTPVYATLEANTTYTLNHELNAGEYFCQIKTGSGVESRAFSVN